MAPKPSSALWRHSAGNRLLFRLLGRYPSIPPFNRGKRTTLTDALQKASVLRGPDQPGEVCLPNIRGHLPRLQVVLRGFSRGLSQSMYRTTPTARTQLPKQIQPRLRRPHHHQLCWQPRRLQALTATSASPHASATSQQNLLD
jgi:hypothetical protein